MWGNLSVEPCLNDEMSEGGRTYWLPAAIVDEDELWVATLMHAVASPDSPGGCVCGIGDEAILDLHDLEFL